MPNTFFFSTLFTFQLKSKEKRTPFPRTNLTSRGLCAANEAEMPVRSRVACDKLRRTRRSKQSDWYFSNKARSLPADRVKTYSGHMASCERLAGCTGTERASKKAVWIPEHFRTSPPQSSLMFFRVFSVVSCFKSLGPSWIRWLHIDHKKCQLLVDGAGRGLNTEAL